MSDSAIWRKTRTLPATCALAGNAVFRAGLDPPKVSSFTGISCHQKGYGLGKVIESWYSTAYLQRLLSRQKLLLL
jgi:hypothetical protein